MGEKLVREERLERNSQKNQQSKNQGDHRRMMQLGENFQHGPSAGAGQEEMKDDKEGTSVKGADRQSDTKLKGPGHSITQFAT